MATNPPDLSLGVGARSEKGRREENQDKMTAFPTSLGTVYIVADGMGGHRGGAEASHMVIEGYRKHLTSFQEGAGLPDVLQAATALTNAEILEAGHSGDPTVAGMGSTVVMAVLRNGATGMEMLTGHIGDSRAYLLRAGALHRLTRDHSAVQRMVDAQILTPEAARSHPDSNVLTRALGQQPNVAIDVSVPEPLLPGDTLLLCSDGLWGYVEDEQIQHELSLDRSASDAADALADLALTQGSDDNITLQVLRLEDRQRAMRAPDVLRQTQVDGIVVNTQGKPAKRWPGKKNSLPRNPDDRIAPPESGPRSSRRFVIYGLILFLSLALGALAWLLARHYRPHPKLPKQSPVTKPNNPLATKKSPTPAGVNNSPNRRKDLSHHTGKNSVPGPVAKPGTVRRSSKETEIRIGTGKGSGVDVGIDKPVPDPLPNHPNAPQP